MPIDIIIERYKKIEALNDRFIALIPPYRGDDTAKLFYEHFGERCVDLREYCKENVWKDYGITKTEMDIKCLNDVVLATSFIYASTVTAI